MCKCGCGKPPTIGSRGFNFSCLPVLEQTEKRNNKQKQHRTAQIKAINRKRLHDVQKEVHGFNFVPKRPKPIASFSKKRLADIKIYSVLRKDYLLDHKICEVKLDGCSKKAIEIHHLYSGRDRNKYFIVVETWKSTCRNCHRKLHDELSTEQLIELGLRKID